MKKIEEGSVIRGTHRNADIIPAIIKFWFEYDKEQCRRFWVRNPEMLQAICDKNAGVPTDWWETVEAAETVFLLFDKMNEIAPDGMYFGAHPGDGSDFGFWKSEE